MLSQTGRPAKKKKKLAKKIRMGKVNLALKVTEATSQTEPVLIADQEEIREEIRAVVKFLAIEGPSDEENSSSESDLSDEECDKLNV